MDNLHPSMTQLELEFESPMQRLCHNIKELKELRPAYEEAITYPDVALHNDHVMNPVMRLRERIFELEKDNQICMLKIDLDVAQAARASLCHMTRHCPNLGLQAGMITRMSSLWFEIENIQNKIKLLQT